MAGVEDRLEMASALGDLVEEMMGSPNLLSEERSPAEGENGNCRYGVFQWFTVSIERFEKECPNDISLKRKFPNSDGELRLTNLAIKRNALPADRDVQLVHPSAYSSLILIKVTRPTSIDPKFHFLSHVMSYNKRSSTTDAEFDVENPVPAVPTTDEPQFEPDEKMPPLNNPKLIETMRNAVSDVSNTRSVLQSLGTRPDHETVDNARTRISEIDAGGSKEAIEDYKIYKAVIAMDEMHEAYEKMLNEAEMRLKSIYEEAMARNDEVQDKGKNVLMEEEFNEDVAVILKEAESGKGAERIDLSGKGLRFFPEAFGRLKSCVVMNLASNHLQTIPDSIAGLENLEELNLSANLLESLPDSIGLLFKLKVLDVSGNKLAFLPDSISHCRSLIELDASFNKLTYLPTNIGYEMVNLKRLSIQLNKIRSLPTSIGEMKSLRLLDLHFNELHGLPPSIGRLTNLEILNLSSNFSDLKNLPDTFGDIISLRELDLSNNQIHSLPDTFGRLVNLTKLNLDQNPITIPPKEIVAQGVEAVRAFMAERLAQIILEEENKLNSPRPAADASLLTRSTSWLTNVVSGYWSGGAGKPNAEDPYLNQQF